VILLKNDEVVDFFTWLPTNFYFAHATFLT